MRLRSDNLPVFCDTGRDLMTNHRLLHITCYLASTLITGVAVFLYIPLLIRTLGLNEFGRWSVLEPLIFVLPQLAVSGLSYGFIKQVNVDKLKPAVLYWRYLAKLQPLFCLSAISSIPITYFLGLSWTGAFLFSTLVYLEAYLLFTLSAFRGANLTIAYTATSVVKPLALLTIFTLAAFTGVPTLTSAHNVVYYWIVASGLGSLTGIVFSAVTMPPNSVQGESDSDAYREARHYGKPFLILSLLSLTLNFTDRFFLKSLLSFEHLASYVTHVKISSCINMIVSTPFGLWWPTERFKRLENRSQNIGFFSFAAFSLASVYIIIGGNLIILSPHIFNWLAPAIPFDVLLGSTLVYAVVIAGMGAPLNVGLFDQGHTYKNIIAALVGVAVNLSLCIILIPKFGVYGAAFASLAGNLALIAQITRFSQRVLYVPFAYFQMAATAAVSMILLFILMNPSWESSVFNFEKAIIYTLAMTSILMLLAWHWHRQSGLNDGMKCS